MVYLVANYICFYNMWIAILNDMEWGLEVQRYAQMEKKYNIWEFKRSWYFQGG